MDITEGQCWQEGCTNKAQVVGKYCRECWKGIRAERTRHHREEVERFPWKVEMSPQRKVVLSGDQMIRDLASDDEE